MFLPVARGQADPAALGVRVRVRGALAGQIRQEEETLRPGRRLRRFLAQDFVRVHASIFGLQLLCVGQVVAPPLEAAAGREHHSHDVPLARDRVAERVDAAERVGLDFVGKGEDHAGGAQRGGYDHAAHDAVAHGARGLVASAPDDRHAGLETQLLGRGRAELRADFLGLVAFRQQRAVYIELVQHGVRPAAAPDVEK